MFRRKRRGPDTRTAPTTSTSEPALPADDEQTTTDSDKAAVGEESADQGLAERVRAYQEQAVLASRLAETPDQDFEDPTSNPRVLDHLLARRDEVHRHVIDANAERTSLQARLEHDRLARSIEDEDRWERARAARENRAIQRARADADEAGRDVQAIEEAQRATRPASAATHLARTQERVVRAYLGFAVAGSVMSAIGIAHAVFHGSDAGWASAVAMAATVEIPSTALATFVIWTQGLLHRNDRSATTVREPGGMQVRVEAMAHLSDRVRNGPWNAVKALLAVSVAVNLWGTLFVGTALFGVLGMVGAGVAALASLLGWGYSLQSSAIITANMTSPGVSDALAERRRVAAGADIPTATLAPATSQPSQPSRVRPVDPRVLDELFDDIAHHLDPNETEHGGVATLPQPNSHDWYDQGERPESDDADSTSFATNDLRKHCDQRGGDTENSHDCFDQRKHAAEQARRVQVENARQRRDAAMALWQQGLCAGEIAQQLERDLRTVTTYLTEEGLTSVDLGERTRARMLDLIEENGVEITTRDLARRLGLGRTTAREHRQTLHQRGHHVTNTDQ